VSILCLNKLGSAKFRAGEWDNIHWE
jgi:hypothetical protein